MKNWLIKRLGGYTKDECDRLQTTWDAAAAALKAQEGRPVTIIDGPVAIYSSTVLGALIVAPRSGAFISGCYRESSFLPIDSDGRLH
jgi:hypothetical protein